MSKFSFRFPDTERDIIWRYLDGVSQALARRFDGGSSPSEENLTFLLCELLDEGTTGLHLLEYPLGQAKEDLARADGGLTLDVCFQTHEHTKHAEHHFSGADLGVIFVVEHPYFGRSERAVLLQAKRVFPASTGSFTLNSSFSSFHVQRRFSAENSIFYLWYTPASRALSDGEAKLLRSLEAIDTSDWRDLRGWHPFLDEMIEFRGLWHERHRGLSPQSPPTPSKRGALVNRQRVPVASRSWTNLRQADTVQASFRSMKLVLLGRAGGGRGGGLRLSPSPNYSFSRYNRTKSATLRSNGFGWLVAKRSRCLLSKKPKQAGMRLMCPK